MKILVTGATGFIGLEVSRQLAERGLSPRLMVRRMPRAVLISSLDADFVMADLLSRESLARAASGMDAIIHLGARATFESYDILRPTILDGSLMLMEEAASAGVKTFVYGSTLLVYGNQRAPVDASTEASPSLDYGRIKLESEELLRNLAQQAGMTFASVRLPHTYGSMDLFFEQIRRGRILVPGSCRNPFGRMHIHDAAKVLIEAALQRWDGTSPVADEYSATWGEFLGTIRKFYVNLRERRFPKAVSLLATYLLKPYQRFKKTPALYTADAVVGWNLSIPVAQGLLWKDLGLCLRYPTIEEGIPAVLDDIISFRWSHPVFDKC